MERNPLTLLLGGVDFRMNHTGHFKALLWVELIFGVIPPSVVFVWGSGVGATMSIFVIVDLFRGRWERLDEEMIFIAFIYVFGLLGLFALWNVLLARIFDWPFSPGEARVAVACLLCGIAVAISLVGFIGTAARPCGWICLLLLLPVVVAVRNAPFVIVKALGHNAT